MQRMTDALSRMLNDPSTRLAMQRLNTQGEGAELTNREPRHDPGELGAGPSQGQQSRAAVSTVSPTVPCHGAARAMVSALLRDKIAQWHHGNSLGQ